MDNNIDKPVMEDIPETDFKPVMKDIPETDFKPLRAKISIPEKSPAKKKFLDEFYSEEWCKNYFNLEDDPKSSEK